MRDALLLRMNLMRNLLRTLLLVASILFAFSIFGVLGSIYAAFERPAPGGSNRLLVSNQVNYTEDLPIAYFERVQRVDGVEDATFLHWFGGYIGDPQDHLTVFAVDPASFLRIYADAVVLTDAQQQAFREERTGLLVSEELARDRGLRLGQRVPMPSVAYQRADGREAWDFVIVGIFSGAEGASPGDAYFNYEYYNETVARGRDEIGTITVTTASPSQNDAVAARIDAMFANSSAPTETESAQEFSRALVAQLGDLRGIILMVVPAVFAAILIVVAATMMLTARERIRELGVLRVLGFSGARLALLSLAETLLVSLSGAVLGMAAAALAFLSAPALRDYSAGAVMAPLVIGAGLLIAIAFGLMTGLAPALWTLRLSPLAAMDKH